jgi:hypothetical protein
VAGMWDAGWEMRRAAGCRDTGVMGRVENWRFGESDETRGLNVWTLSFEGYESLESDASCDC